MSEIIPYKRNTSAEREIKKLYEKKAEYQELAKKKQLEIEVINSDISLIDAQVADMMMKKRRSARR